MRAAAAAAAEKAQSLRRERMRRRMRKHVAGSSTVGGRLGLPAPPSGGAGAGPRRGGRVLRPAAGSGEGGDSSAAGARAGRRGSMLGIGLSALEEIENATYPCSLEQWSLRQDTCRQELLEDLEEDWRQRFASELHDSLQPTHNLFARDQEEYTESALLPIMRRQHSIMASQLRFVVDTSIDDLMVFLAKSCEDARVRSNALRVFGGMPRDSALLLDPDHEGRLMEVATYGLDGLAAPREMPAS